ncbi:MAG: hypothetical protein V2I26_08320 [Halieaceae bacterium]|jgi:hypothetical protein|nr:hypothetical protein [Halieaceae bacterium]
MALVLGLLGALPALAQPEGNSRSPWVWGLAGGAVHQMDADLKSGDGQVSVSRVFVQPSLGYAWDRRNSVSLSLGAGYADYDFSDGARVGGTRPWGDVRDVSLSLPIRFSPSERADVIVIPGVRSFYEEGADVDEGRTEGVIAAAGWKFSDSLTLGPGFGWFSELGGGSNAFPIILIDWQITRRLSLTTGRGLAASQGPGLTLNYDLADKWVLGLTGRSEKTRFALDEDSTRKEGFGEDKSLPLLLTLSYSPWPRTSVSALLGAEFEGSLRKENSRGNVIAKSDFDTAVVFGVVFSSQF